MTYADPHACPACRGPIGGVDTCPRCGFDLGSPEAQRLWGLFLEADRLVAQGRSRQGATAPGATAPVVTGAVTSPTPSTSAMPAAPAMPAAAVPPVRTWSTGSILLGLGAVCLIVAAIIFATVAWGSLGILGRALILLAVTALVGTAAAWATRRALVGTAEALWTVFLGLVTVDLLAAVAEGLFGLSWSDFALVSVVWTAVLVGSGIAIVRWSRPRLDRELITPQLAAGFAPYVSAPAVMIRLGDLGEGDHWFWAAAAGLVLPLAVIAVAHRTRLRWMLWPSALLALLFAVVLVALAIDSALGGSRGLTLGDALPSLSLAVLAVAGARLVRPLRPWLIAFAVVAVLFLLGVAVDGWAWSAGLDTTAAGLVAVAVVVAVLAALVRRPDAWSLGVRWGAVVAAGALLLWCGAASTATLERTDRAGWFSSPRDVWIRPAEMSITEGWWVLAVALPLVVAWLATARWPAPRLVPDEWRVPIAEIAAGAAVVTAVGASTLPFLVHAITLVVVGVVLAVVLRTARWELSIVPVAVVALAMIVVPLGGPSTAWAWGVAAVGALACAAVGLDEDPPGPRRLVSAGAAGLAAFAIVATVAQVADLADVAPGAWGVVVFGVAAGLLLLTLALDEMPWHRTAVEVVVAATLLVCVVRDGDDLARVALLLTIGAVVTAIVGLLDDDRTYLRWVALGLTGGAWVARLAASEVETIEAYTAPFAVAVLAAGWWRLRTDPDSRTWTALTPGLVLALLPSLPQALDEPTSLRAALLALVAAAVLGAGVVLRWGAPVIAGAAVLLLLVLANVGPTALGLPRWILIAVAGLVLLLVGTTWEKRVAEGRALVARLGALR